MFFLLYSRFHTCCKMNRKIIKEPKAIKKEEMLQLHGDVRIDSYYWLNQRENPDVIEYLKEENLYTKKMLEPTEVLQKELFLEIKGRIEEEYENVSYLYNDYQYITRYKKGKEYPTYIRKKLGENQTEELLFEVNEMAEGYAYYDMGNFEISSNNSLAVFSEDVIGRRIYTLRFKNLETLEILSDKIENTTGDALWASDDRTVFYIQKDSTLRPYKVFKHILGRDSKEDKLVFHEKNDQFHLSISKSKDERYLFIHSKSTLSDEYRFIKSDQPDAQWRIFQKRETGLEYDVDHLNQEFYIVTNKDGAVNFKVMKTSEMRTNQKYWMEVIPHRKDYLIEDIELFKNYLVVQERYKGKVGLYIQSWDKSMSYQLDFSEETYEVSIGINFQSDTNLLRYNYSSLTTPLSVIDLNMETHQREVKKEQKVVGGNFDKNNYVSERIWAPSRDGKKIPISLVHRRDIEKSANTPLLLYGYGSYGYTVDPSFESSRLSLLDRGFIFAIAHVRGGQYLGRTWYEEGKLLKKRNTFNDFIDSAKYLVEKQYTSPEHLYAIGGSAGGMLMGVVANMAPALFNGIIAAVPFVDVVTTMLDENVPLTTGEYDEWGDPRKKEYYAYMKSYSPYDNVVAKEYPNILVTTGLNDSQVQYWEPTKWVAKLREMKKGTNYLLLHTDMDTGHSGASGRFDFYKEVAMEYAFLLHLENHPEIK